VSAPGPAAKRAAPLKISRNTGRSETTRGTPAASASMAARPKPSLAEGKAKTPAAATSDGRTSSSTAPRTTGPGDKVAILSANDPAAFTEAPMMISTLAPKDHFHADGTLARERFSSAGRPTPLVTVAIMDSGGALLPAGERGEIVVRGSLVMAGYYKNPRASAEAARYGWHHTGDIGYLDAGNYLFIVDRAKDMIITGGFNVYSAPLRTCGPSPRPAWAA
jgi:acyl-CoA synthetase (AMP-forming)/AMP-acid ligase II